MSALRVVHDWPMTPRPVLTIAIASFVVAACGAGDSDSADTTLPDVTLLTTTSEAPLFEEADADGDGESATTIGASDASTTPETDVSTAPPGEPAATTVAPPADVETTTTAPAPVTESTPVETAPPPVGGEFVLGADGLGAVPFGADPEQTIAFVTSIIGAPTMDTGWLDPFEIGPCGGDRIRQVSWNQLQLEFGDVSNVTEGQDHFYSFFYGVEGSSTPQPPGLKTAEKIGAGSSVAELIAAYSGVMLIEGDEFLGPSFTVNDNLAGRLSGVADDDVVEAIIGGRPCDG